MQVPLAFTWDAHLPPASTWSGPHPLLRTFTGDNALTPPPQTAQSQPQPIRLVCAAPAQLVDVKGKATGEVVAQEESRTRKSKPETEHGHETEQKHTQSETPPPLWMTVLDPTVDSAVAAMLRPMLALFMDSVLTTANLARAAAGRRLLVCVCVCE